MPSAESTPEIPNLKLIRATHQTHARSRLTGDELIDWSREQMAAYKYPRIIDIVDSLPTTATGKILKRELT
nr:hypothetical protein [Rhodococcus opacus]